VVAMASARHHAREHRFGSIIAFLVGRTGDSGTGNDAEDGERGQACANQMPAAWAHARVRDMAHASLWQRILNLFRPTPNQSAVSVTAASAPVTEKAFDHDAIDKALFARAHALLQLDFSSVEVREQHRADVFALLVDIDRRIDWIEENANSYPNGTISTDVWFAGYGIAALAERLTGHFKAAGWLGNEANAANLWAKSTLSVCSHYHHMVGPAMLASADCAERQGKPDEAMRSYNAVVADFAWLSDEWNQETAAPPGDQRLALSCLKTAAERLIALDAGEERSPTQLAELIATLDAILSRDQ
jgi:hypothetical protein